MNEVFVLDKEFLFKSNIYEITNISIEHNYDLSGSKCEGEFVISGDYRLHEVSVNKEDFNFKIPFEIPLRSNVNLDSVEVEVNDFTYDVEGDVLGVHVEYQVSGEQSLIEFAEEADLDAFLKQNETAEIIDLSEEERTEETVESVLENPVPAVITEPLVSEERAFEVIPEEIAQGAILPEVEELAKAKENIMEALNSEESFITYHVHTVVASDTFESITAAYNVNIIDLKKLNNIEELAINMKLIIPDETD